MPLRKRVIERTGLAAARHWLALEELAQVEVTSEDPAHPIDSALVADHGSGWRASQPGDQLIRLSFHDPRAIRLIHLVFDDQAQERVQEFSLRWSSDRGRTYRAIVRQQFFFSPSGATREVEDYAVDLTGVTDIELRIEPDISRRPVVANMRALRIQ